MMSDAARDDDIISSTTTPDFILSSAIYQKWTKMNDGDTIRAYSKTFTKPDDEDKFIKHITTFQKAYKRLNEKRKAKHQQAKGYVKLSPLVIDENYARATPTFRKWMKLKNGQRLLFHQKPYTKIADDDTNEKRLIRRIIDTNIKNYEFRQVTVLTKANNNSPGDMELSTHDPELKALAETNPADEKTNHDLEEEEEEVITNVDFDTDVDGANLVVESEMKTITTAHDLVKEAEKTSPLNFNNVIGTPPDVVDGASLLNKMREKKSKISSNRRVEKNKNDGLTTRKKTSGEKSRKRMANEEEDQVPFAQRKKPLTWDYQWAHDVNRPRTVCKCGSKNCRGYLEK